MSSNDEKGEAQFVSQLDQKVEWGFYLPYDCGGLGCGFQPCVCGGSYFIPIPKLPLVMAGMRKPPFDVLMPSGSIRHIVERTKHVTSEIRADGVDSEHAADSEPRVTHDPVPQIDPDGG